MLDQALKDQVRGLFANLQQQYTFRIQVRPNHPQRNELIELLSDVADCSARIGLVEQEGPELSFVLEQNQKPTQVIFRAVPNGHEFTTLLLAILNLEGIGKNLPDDTLRARMHALQGPVVIKSYISLTCTNCPDVVQALNLVAYNNPNIRHEIVDGALYPDEAKELGIQAVPTVYANGQLLHVGRSSAGELVSKLEQQLGTHFSAQDTPVRAFDVLVVGGGPAGISAAIYSARKGLKVGIVAQQIGGQLTETLGIENMISVAQTTGSHLTANLKDHLAHYPVEILENRMVESVELVEGKKLLRTSLGEQLIAPALIIATGASWRRLNVPGEQRYIGTGVAFCAHCDGPFYKGKRVAVVGGGNSGLEAALDLSSLASEVTLIEYLDQLKGDQVLQDKLQKVPNVRIITSAQTLEIQGDGAKVTGLNLRHRHTQTEEQLGVDGVFVQIGLKANAGPFAQLVALSPMGEIVVDAHCRTNVPGVYAAGDVSVVPFKQIVIAMGEGAKAALSAFEDYLKGTQLAG